MDLDRLGWWPLHHWELYRLYCLCRALARSERWLIVPAPVAASTGQYVDLSLAHHVTPDLPARALPALPKPSSLLLLVATPHPLAPAPV